MPVGDILAKLAEGQKLTGGEIDETRLVMNAFQSKLGALSGLLDQTGRLNPNVFANAGGFSLLPHECGSIHGVPGGSLSVADTTWTTITGGTGAATWSKGFRADPTTGYIYCSGVPRDSVLLIVIYVTWEGDIHGNKVDIKWKADDGSEIVKTDTVPASHTDNYNQYLTHARRTPSGETYYYVQGAQYSGGAKNIVDFNFVVARLR